eukprot:jgi/Mesvir1/16902/Mv15772-RA.1
MVYIAPAISTCDVSLVSHTHGRLRRIERNIDRSELQAAVKHGRKEAANPGPKGDVRWRYTHKGIVYITDASSRHEITSWRIDDGDIEDAPPLARVGDAEYTSHTVLIVDASGSMRKSDVPGYTSRTDAVYDCLAREFVEPQLKGVGRNGSAANGKNTQLFDKAVASLIEMSDDASVVLNRVPVDEALASALRSRRTSYARSHGNYLPALQKAIELLREDAHHNARLFVLFLSDGAPSDHNEMECSHGIQVWQADPSGRLFKGKPALNNCWKGNSTCRRVVHDNVKADCLRAVTKLGDLFGRDRTFLGTVAFGPPGDDYEVLQKMAQKLPRSSFQKLGLQVGGLKTALSSLTSELTTLRTEAGVEGGMGRVQGTPRNKVVRKESEEGGAILSSYDGAVAVSEGDGWSLYDRSKARKYRYDLNDRDLVQVAFDDGASGMAFYQYAFAEGVERFVFRCMEIGTVQWDGSVGDWIANQVGKKLVAKEAKTEEQLGLKFQKDFCRTQSEAAALAKLFNDRVHASDPSWRVDFLKCQIYRCEDSGYPNGVAWVLAEPELEGKFSRWNNNGGGVSNHAYPPTRRAGGIHAGSGGRDAVRSAGRTQASLLSSSALGAIVEDGEDDDAGEPGCPGGHDSDDGSDEASSEVELHEIPQCFSHFTYVVTGHKKLVCDLQGVWNATDGFMLTDPAIHYISSTGRRGINGMTDKGQEGVDRFFKTHQCRVLCRRLGLNGTI